MRTKRSTQREVPGDRRLGSLIDRLGPINNDCRRADGVEKVERLWDLGDALLEFDATASDELLWAIAERSYLTRDLLRYALIIRRGWPQRAEFRKSFARLTSYSLFRDALPFLKGDRSGIDDDTYRDVVGRLNAGNPEETRKLLASLKAKKIGRTHKKGRAVAKMSDAAETIRVAVRQLVDVATQDRDRVQAARTAVTTDGLIALSQWCMAVADDGTPPHTLLEPDKWPEPFQTLGNTILVVARGSKEDRAGLRKALGPLVLMEAADLLNSLRSKEHIEQWKRRRRLELSL